MKLPANDRMLPALCLVVLLVGATGSAQAQLYKWVDDEGNTHYSDKSPEDREHSTVNTTVSPARQALEKADQLQPIILPFGRSSRRIILSKSFYRWRQAAGSKRKVGIYYSGPYCTSRGPIYTSDIATYHPGFLLSEDAIPRSVKKSLVKIGYDSYIVKLQDLEARMKAYQGVYLKAEIVDLVLDACAPIYSTSRALTPKEVSSSSFTRNRATIQVNWKLYSHLDSSPIFETDTVGYYDSWKIRKTAYETVREALNLATDNLLADPRLVDLVTFDADDNLTKQQDDATVADAKVAQETGWWESLMPGGSKSISELLVPNLQARAKVAGIMSEANSLKVMSTSYFMQNDEWPTIVQDIGFSDRLFEDHDSIEGLKLGLDGTIRLLLKDEVFGPSRVLELTPDIEAYLAGGSLNLRWDCFSNLQPEVLPEVCKSM